VGEQNRLSASNEIHESVLDYSMPSLSAYVNC